MIKFLLCFYSSLVFWFFFSARVLLLLFSGQALVILGLFTKHDLWWAKMPQDFKHYKNLYFTKAILTLVGYKIKMCHKIFNWICWTTCAIAWQQPQWKTKKIQILQLWVQKSVRFLIKYSRQSMKTLWVFIPLIAHSQTVTAMICGTGFWTNYQCTASWVMDW